jgi:hypothetical protein
MLNGLALMVLLYLFVGLLMGLCVIFLGPYTYERKEVATIVAVLLLLWPAPFVCMAASQLSRLCGECNDSP